LEVSKKKVTSVSDNKIQKNRKKKEIILINQKFSFFKNSLTNLKALDLTNGKPHWLSKAFSIFKTCFYVLCNQAARILNVTDKLQLTGGNLDRVFNSRSGSICAMRLRSCEAKLHSLKLKTWSNNFEVLSRYISRSPV
jgi:hypothetical protein